MCRRNWAFHTRRKGSRPARRETRSDRGKDAIRLRNRRRPHSLRPRRQLPCDRTWHTTGRRSNSNFGLGSQPSCVASQGVTSSICPLPLTAPLPSPTPIHTRLMPMARVADTKAAIVSLPMTPSRSPSCAAALVAAPTRPVQLRLLASGLHRANRIDRMFYIVGL